MFLDRGSFCEATGTLCFGLGMTLPMSFKVGVDRSFPVLFCHLYSVIPRVISGCQGRASNPDLSPRRRARYHCTSPTRQELLSFLIFLFGNFLKEQCGFPQVVQMMSSRQLLTVELKHTKNSSKSQSEGSWIWKEFGRV